MRRQKRCAAVSCSLKRHHFISDIVEVYKPRRGFRVLEMQFSSFDDIGAKLFPRVAFGEYRLADCARPVPTFFSIVNFEDQLHDYRIRFKKGLRILTGTEYDGIS